jgi:hypothetical protein
MIPIIPGIRALLPLILGTDEGLELVGEVVTNKEGKMVWRRARVDVSLGAAVGEESLCRTSGFLVGSKWLEGGGLTLRR